MARDGPLQSPPTSNTAMLLAGARRFGVLLAATAAAVTVCSLAVGALIGVSVNRAVATGFEGFGSLMLVFGFFVGNRGPVRAKGDTAPFFGPRFLRWATPEEFRSTIADSAIFIVLGLVLILFGLAIDSRYRLF